MKKILTTIVLLGVLGFLVLNLFGARVLAGVLEKSIGAPVSVGRLHIGVFSPRLGIYHIKIMNPNGFQEKNLAEIQEISVTYDWAALFRGKVHLGKMILNFGDVTIEKNAGNQVNLLELGAVKGLTQKKAPPPAGAKPLPLQIDEVLVNLGKVRYVDSAIQPVTVKEYDLGVHGESFKNVTQASELVKGIVYLILRKVGLSSLTGNLDLLVKGVGGGIETTFNDLKGKWLNN